MSVLKNKFVIVTGGARGIGYELCKKLLADHRNVIMTSKDLAVGYKTAVKLMLETKSKGQCEVYKLDLSNSKSIQNFTGQITKQFDQQIHTLINNAGIQGLRWQQGVFDQHKKINLEGPVKLVEQILPCMQQHGRIINVSNSKARIENLQKHYREVVSRSKTSERLQGIVFSRNEEFGVPHPIYYVSKAMLNKYTQLLAEDPYVKRKRISVNAVCPGWCRTDAGDIHGSRASRSAEDGADSVMWLVNHPEPSVTGGFYKDGHPVDW